MLKLIFSLASTYALNEYLSNGMLRSYVFKVISSLTDCSRSICYMISCLFLSDNHILLISLTLTLPWTNGAVFAKALEIPVKINFEVQKSPAKQLSFAS